MSSDGPKLLVEWSSPWREFVSAVGPALGRSPAPLAGEAQTGLLPVRGMLFSWGMEAIFLAALILLPAKLASMRPYAPPTPPRYDVIYFSGDELPQAQDFGGAEAGRSGRAGGQEAYHRSQTIRVARGNRTADKVVDAPDLKLPLSSSPVANLLAFKPIPGPPPSEGLKSSRIAPTWSKNAIVAPPPEVFHQLHRAAPGLYRTVIAPPPANLSSATPRQTMGLSTTIIAPAPKDVPREHSRSVIAMNSPIIQPAPTDVQHDPPPLRGPAAATSAVVPPPVSVPPRDSSQPAKLALPAPAVIAPPPSQVTPDQRSVSGASLADPKVIPPPVQLGGRSQDKSAIIGPVGANQVVPPPPSVTDGTSLSGGGRGHNDMPGGFGGGLTADNVVPPPPSISADAARSGSGRGPGEARAGFGGTPETNIVVPPPPNLSGAAGSLAGRGTGNQGGGLGGPLAAGAALAPPSSRGGNGGGKGVVVSSRPGTTVGVPGNATAGIIAMSPAGGSKTGLGGSGGGNGIGHGPGPGSGLSGEGPGAAKAGTGPGSDPNAHGGISPFPGRGGAGNGTTGQPAMPGVSVEGGNTITLPSFGSSESDPSALGRSPASGGKRAALGVTVKGTSRSGGAFSTYGLLKGDNYTIYLPTVDGTVVMLFADPSSAVTHYAGDLTSPEAVRIDLPAGLGHSRVRIACVLAKSGMLRNPQVLEAAPGAPIAKILAALSTWKFTPALRGNEPVEVHAILGFNINTSN
jgi:hypothetical protein